MRNLLLLICIKGGACEGASPPTVPETLASIATLSPWTLPFAFTLLPALLLLAFVYRRQRRALAITLKQKAIAFAHHLAERVTGFKAKCHNLSDTWSKRANSLIRFLDQ